MPVTNSKLARVVLWMVGALLSFSVMAVSIRELAKAALSIFEILAIRSGVALLVPAVLLIVRPNLRVHALPRRMKLNLLRNTVHYASQYAWALSITMLPLAMVLALEFTMPGWTALLAVWLLHERLTPSRVGVVVLGLIGVLVILAARHCQFQSGGVPRAGGGIRLRHHHGHHQAADHDRDHLRHRVLDGGDPAAAFVTRQRPGGAVPSRTAPYFTRNWGRHCRLDVALLP
jgi:hypothetical protein